MRPSFTRKFFSILILWGSLLIAFFSVSYLTLIAAVPTATLWEFTMYLERMLGVSPLTGLESGQVVNSTRLNNQPANYYQRLIWNCGAGYILSVNADGSVICGSPIVPPLPPAFTCAARPAYANASFVDGTPAIANMPWTQIGPNCKYTCTGGFTGIDCSTPPVGNSCAASPACTWYTGCTLTTGTPTSIGQAWTQVGPNCKYTCNAGFSGPTCAPLGASSCMSYSETWSWSGQGGNCSALIPAGFSISDNQVATGPTITLMNTVGGYSGSVTWKCVDSDVSVGTTAVEWIFNGGSCTAIPHCSSTLPACDGIGCTTNLWTPTSANQDWSRNSPNCGFTCNPGYSGVNCEIAPVGWNCGTFSCFAHEQAWGWNVACWNNFKSALTAWTASGYITPAQKTQIEIDGNVSWDATCDQLAGAKATLGWFYRDSILNSLPVTWRFTLDTEEFAVFGGCSVDAQVVCPALPPSPPTGLTGVAWNASVALSWTAPSGIIADYIVEYKTTAWAIWLTFNDGVGTGTTANVIGLTNGTSYDFQVKARNGNGDSGPSNIISATPINPVGACKDAPSGWTDDQCVGFPYGNAELSLVDTNGPAPGGLVWWQSNQPSQGSAIYNSCNGKLVYYKTPAEMAAMPDCAPTGPSAPTVLSGVAGNASVSLSWMAPAEVVTDYIIEYKPTLSAIWLVFADGVSITTNANVTGLTNGTSYDFRVKARNTNGDSGWSNVISRSPGGGGICITENWWPWCGSTMPVLSPILDNGIGPWVTINNTNPGFTGSVQMRCYDGDPVLGNIAYETIVGSGSCTPLTVDACGTAQTTGSIEYPVGAAACTWGAQTDVDINGFDNTYNWNCGALSCSAAVLPHCEVVHTIVWVTETDTLSVWSTSPSYAISTTQPGKFNASCGGRGWATCTDIDPSPTRGEFTCAAVVPPTITWDYGCFVAGTQVTLDSGKTKSIEDIQVGELVKTYDEISKTYVDRPVTEAIHHEERIQTLYTFEYGDQTLTSNHIHRIYLPKDDRYVAAKDIYKRWIAGESLSFQDGTTNTIVPIKHITVEKKVVPVYNLHVSGIHDTGETDDLFKPNHNYLANGVIVHNQKLDTSIDDYNQFVLDCDPFIDTTICEPHTPWAWANYTILCSGTAIEKAAADACWIAPPNSCAASPACIAAWHCTVTANAPTSVGQAWTAGWLQCGYTCSGGWSGANCDVAPVANYWSTESCSCRLNGTVSFWNNSTGYEDYVGTSCSPAGDSMLAGAQDWCGGLCAPGRRWIATLRCQP